jgi:hypothetical protein
MGLSVSPGVLAEVGGEAETVISPSVVVVGWGQVQTSNLLDRERAERARQGLRPQPKIDAQKVHGRADFDCLCFHTSQL